jgi:LysR family hydrogen peroxide-inducible transcriptional activator
MERPSVRQLECFVAVAELLSFRRAAEASFISQPALSLQIQQLERMLGTRLFERDRRRVLLTPAGAELVPHARAALLALDALLESARMLRDPLAGTLRLGVIPTVAPYVLPGVVGPLRKRLPKLRLLLREDTTARLVDQVQAGKLDLALLALEAELGGLVELPLYSDPFVLAASAGHPLSARKSAREQDLAGEDVLLLEDGHCLRDHVLAACGLKPPKASDDDEGFAATSLPTLVQMVGSGLGVTFLPAMAVEAGLTTAVPIAVRPLAVERPSREIVVVWRAGSSRAAEGRLLAEVLREA